MRSNNLVARVGTWAIRKAMAPVGSLYSSAYRVARVSDSDTADEKLVVAFLVSVTVQPHAAHGSAVGTATTLWAGRSGTRIPACTRDLLLTAAHSAYQLTGGGVLSRE